MQCSLDRLPQGISAKVQKLDCKREIVERLKDFGLIEGTMVRVRYKSPDKGVIAMEFRDTVIAMRSRDLKGVKVEWV